MTKTVDLSTGWSAAASFDDESLGPVMILLVDDQPARLLTYRAILAGLDENLVEASSGTEALKLLMTHEFALILPEAADLVIDAMGRRSRSPAATRPVSSSPRAR